MPLTLNTYLDPLCKKPKQSRALDAKVKYLSDADPLCSKSVIFSTNLYAANRTPTPCSKYRGAKRKWNEICLALDGVPCMTKRHLRRWHYLKEFNRHFLQLYRPLSA